MSLVAALAALPVLGVGACSDDGLGASEAPTGPGTGSGASAGVAGAGNGGGTAAAPGTGGDPALLVPDAGVAGAAGEGNIEECTGQHYAGEEMPVSLLIMMDRSVSMGSGEDYLIPDGGGTKHAAVAQGLYAFFETEAAVGLGVGIDFYGQWGTDASGVEIDNCAPVTYSTPEVEIGLLPGIGVEILGAHSEWGPGGTTPTRPALEGAIIAAQAFKTEHPGNSVYVVFVTDGAPNGCGDGLGTVYQTADDLAAIAEAAAADPHTPVGVFALGILGQEVPVTEFEYLVNTLAEGGGTTPIIIDVNTDLATTFTAALESIRVDATPPCSIQIPLPPPDEMLNYEKINVIFTPPGANAERVLQDPACAGGSGWYYGLGPGGVPATIELCPVTCDAVTTTAGAQFDVEMGCDTLTFVQ